jgi:hypothetical protein
VLFQDQIEQLTTANSAHNGAHLSGLDLQLGDDKLEVFGGRGVHQLSIDLERERVCVYVCVCVCVC